MTIYYITYCQSTQSTMHSNYGDITLVMSIAAS